MVRSMKFLRISGPLTLLALLFCLLFFGESRLEDGFLRGLLFFVRSYKRQSPYTYSILAWVRNRPSTQESKSLPFHEEITPPPIKISASDRPAPITGARAEDMLISKAYKNALKDIDLSIHTLMNHDPIFSTSEFKASRKGVPGTRIRTNSERQDLQKWLDCTSGEGEWRWEPINDRAEPRTMTVHKQGAQEAKCERAFYESSSSLGMANRSRSTKDNWDVRPSLKFRWFPSPKCDNTLKPPKIKPTLSRRNLCDLLRHRSILIVGDLSQYSLHDLLLDWTSTKQTHCAGNLYCKIHAICSDDQFSINWNGNSTKLENGELDSHVYHQIPPQPSSQIHFTKNVSSSSTLEEKTPRSSSNHERGTFLRYRRSDSLWGSTSSTDPRFDPVWIHPNNGIRDINNFWYGDVRKSDLVILSRRPLGLPLRDTTLKNLFRASQNMKKSQSVYNKHLDYLRRFSGSDPKVWGTKSDALLVEWNKGERTGDLMIKMAIKTVLEIWLPEVLFTLLQLLKSDDPRSQERLIVWRGEWRMHGDCVSSTSGNTSDNKNEFDWDQWWNGHLSVSAGDGRRPHSSPPDLLSILFPPPNNQTKEPGSTKIDIHQRSLIFHNLQVIFQNHIMRNLVPNLGIPFLDLESLASVWRTGLVASPTFNANHHLLADCYHYCLPSPGLHLEESFLGGLSRILSF
ncbi:hypothetical protein MJO28_011441 [Puccinia striiformis f. sp. tritici]|uniref:Uncharacterized protein n=1 Tax=Puccinia striiformis f. sp. tritici TaxID=168172 RepID=A0ACC0E560_9BASI|nr:hypothetical protein MJO28_011441 [Puccinia striiformis f. sp. tritici]